MPRGRVMKLPGPLTARITYISDYSNYVSRLRYLHISAGEDFKLHLGDGGFTRVAFPVIWRRIHCRLHDEKKNVFVHYQSMSS